MLKYLIVHLDDTSVSFCHYTNTKTEKKLIDLNILNKALLWAMKENLTIQFVFPDYDIPAEYYEAIDSVEHADIVSSHHPNTRLRENADVVVFGNPSALKGYVFQKEQAYVVRTTLSEFFDNYVFIGESLPNVDRLNVVITDVPAFDREAQLRYKDTLCKLSEIVGKEYGEGHSVQISLLTDRLLLDKMNNCNAGDEHVTLTPDGNFYVCPAFYVDEKETYTLGSVTGGLEIRNPKLYKLSHAPICRTCDAYQCKRCVWLNRKLTLEVNTPSHEQCVMAHLERNQSRELLADIRKIGQFIPGKEIPKLDYLDPFDKILEEKGI